MNFPQSYNKCINYLKLKSQKTSIFVIYNLISIFSKCQLLFNKCNNSIFLFLKKNNCNLYYLNNILSVVFKDENIIFIDKYNFISYIKQGEIILSNVINNSKDNDKQIIENKQLEYDFIIFNYFDNNNSISNFIFPSLPSTFNTENFKDKFTNYRFIQIEIIFPDKSFLIDLSTKQYNFYIENNCIDNLFLLYLLKNFYNMNFYSNDYLLNYKLVIIDQDVNIIELDNQDLIILEMNNYTIKKNPPLTKDILEETKSRKVTSSMNFTNQDQDNLVEGEYIEIENKLE